MFSSNTSQVSSAANYVEDVFSTYLYTGNNSTLAINNGIDLSGKGGLVWLKGRSNAESNALFDTGRGAGNYLMTNATNGQLFESGFVSFNSNGFTLGSPSSIGINNASRTYASWTFRKQAKFFDCVTWTSNGLSNQTVPHSLGVVPAFIVYKRLDAASDWLVLAQNSSGSYYYLYLNRSDASPIAPMAANTTGLTATTFNMNAIQGSAAGQEWIAYMFASNAGGFGLTGTDSVVSCGSFTVSSSSGSTDVNIGYEPQWLLVKPATDPGFATNWNIYDTMRGWVNTTDAGNVNRRLNPNLSNAETTDKQFQPTATGFTMLNSNVYPGVSITYIYVAIRRGPMKTPTSGTSVYTGVARTGTGATATITAGFAPDAVIFCNRTRSISAQTRIVDKLRGAPKHLMPNYTNAEASDTDQITAFTDTGLTIGSDATEGNLNWSGASFINWLFARAPSFFDVVCYTGDSVNNRALNHNLGVAPELIIYKRRSVSADWVVMSSMFPNGGDALFLQSTSAISSNAYGAVPRPTATLFYVRDWGALNNVGDTYVSYLFSSCPGVSKVGSYTGNGTTKQIDCGFTGGARFVLIKRTDSTGDWYVWDSARGIVAGNDPYLFVNGTAVEVTNTDYIDTYSAGFEISSTAPAAINANGGTFIFLAIA